MADVHIEEGQHEMVWRLQFQARELCRGVLEGLQRHLRDPPPLIRIDFDTAKVQIRGLLYRLGCGIWVVKALEHNRNHPKSHLRCYIILKVIIIQVISFFKKQIKKTTRR